MSVLYSPLSIACHFEICSSLPTTKVPSIIVLELDPQGDYIGHMLAGKLEDNKHRNRKSILKTCGNSTNVAIICGGKKEMAIWLMIPLEDTEQKNSLAFMGERRTVGPSAHTEPEPEPGLCDLPAPSTFLPSGQCCFPQRLSQKTIELHWTDLYECSFNHPKNLAVNLIGFLKPAHLELWECQDNPGKWRGHLEDTQRSLFSVAQRAMAVTIKGNSHPKWDYERPDVQCHVMKISVSSVQCLLQRFTQGWRVEGRGWVEGEIVHLSLPWWPW